MNKHIFLSKKPFLTFIFSCIEDYGRSLYAQWNEFMLVNKKKMILLHKNFYEFFLRDSLASPMFTLLNLLYQQLIKDWDINLFIKLYFYKYLL